MKSDNISIVIPTKDRMVDLKRCLESINEQLEKGDEIIIVDGGDINQTKQMLIPFSNNNIKVIGDASSNIPHALNLGIEMARNDIIGFVNDDIEFQSNWIKNLKYWYKELPDAVSIGGTTNNVNKRKVESIFARHITISKLYDKLVVGGALNKTAIITEWGSFSIGNGEPTNPIRVSSFSGANMVLLKSVLKEIGGFNTIFKYACFEAYSYIKLLQMKKNVYLVPGCSVKHYPNPNGGTRNPFYLAQDYAVFFRTLRPISTIGKIRKLLNEISFFALWFIIYKGSLNKMGNLFSGYLSGLRIYKKHKNDNFIA